METTEECKDRSLKMVQSEQQRRKMVEQKGQIQALWDSITVKPVVLNLVGGGENVSVLQGS